MSFSFASIGGIAKNVLRFGVTRLVYNSYKWGRFEQDRLELSLTRIRYDAYRSKLAELAGQVGCAKAGQRARPPSGKSRRSLDNLSTSEAKGIVETYNNDLQQAIGQLFEANPIGLKRYYEQGLSNWYTKRKQWKSPQIVLYTVQSARNLAREDFDRNNKRVAGSPLYRFIGPPPKEKECAKLMAMGAVELSVVEANPTLIHINCPHEWGRVPNKRKVDCNKLWMG